MLTIASDKNFFSRQFKESSPVYINKTMDEVTSIVSDYINSHMDELKV